MARFCPLFSGSSGNCMYIGSSGGSILIDAGKNAKQIELAMNSVLLEPEKINAIFITHEHTDHISGLRVFATRYNIPVFASRGTLEYLENKNHINGKYNVDEITEKGVCIAGMYIKPFRISHDCEDGFGYRIHTADDRIITIATDLGYMTDEVREGIKGSDLVAIESNHDEQMLQCGEYPYHLKRRILSDIGHLSNRACAKEIPEFAKCGTTRFVLSHLSRENNHPELAMETALCSLTEIGMKQGYDFEMTVAHQNLQSKLHII